MPNATTSLYSVKMRASRGGEHISGAERICTTEHVGPIAASLNERALGHPKGTPDEIHLTVRGVDPDSIGYVPALEVAEVPCDSPEQARDCITARLKELGVAAPVARRVDELMHTVSGLRGAMLVDARTGERIEPDRERGVRVTNLDARSQVTGPTKNHHHEALVLASKVCHHPKILAEVCISDDPDYTTGYLAARGTYYRIPNIKRPGDSVGTRAFVCAPMTAEEKKELISYLEDRVIVVDDAPAPPVATPSFGELCAQENRRWRQADLERTQRVFGTAQEATATVDGAERVLLSSSNYLGLSQHPEVVAAATGALRQFGTGSGGSRLTTGTTTWHARVEEAFASFTGYEDAVFFATGYQANLSTIQALNRLAGGNLEVFSDQLNHASLIDGCRIAGLHARVYPHRDMAALESLLSESRAEHKLIVSDGVFSMDGTVAPLPSLRRLADAYGAWLYIDDAHGVGTLGARGRGTIERFGVRPDILMATASKALGAEGGAVCTNAEFAHLLRNQARSYVFSTATSAANCAAVCAALGVIDREPVVVDKLHANIERLSRLLQEAGIPVPDGGWETPIVPIPIGDEAHALRVSERLQDAGFHVPAIRYPTVPRGKAILRVTLMSTITGDQLARFVEALATAM